MLTILSSGGYGPFTVTESVQVVAAPGVQAMTTPNSTSPAQAVVVNAPGKRVVLRGLYVQHYVVGNVVRAGIRAKAFKSLHIEGCVVDGFTGNGIEVIYSPASGTEPELYITDTVVRGSGLNGIFIQGESPTRPIHAVLERVRAVDGGGTGGTAGIRILSSVRAAVRGSVSSGNVSGFTAHGVVDGVTAQLSLVDCVATRNFSVGVSADADGGGGAAVDVSGTTIMFNGIGVSTGSGGGVFSRGDNTLRRNTGSDGAFTSNFTPD